jgi:hypothetical protein
VDVRIVEGLRRRGVDAFSAREKGALGINDEQHNDEQHFEKAKDLKGVIFTHDPHFIEIAEKLVQSGKGHYGLIFAEMHRFGLGECIRRLALYAEIILSQEMTNRIEFL